MAMFSNLDVESLPPAVKVECILHSISDQSDQLQEEEISDQIRFTQLKKKNHN